MTQSMLCNSCKNIMIQSNIKKPRLLIKHATIVERRELVEKQQSSSTPTNEDNISTKSSRQQSQS